MYVFHILQYIYVVTIYICVCVFMFAYKFTCFYIDIFRDEVSPMYPKFSCRVHQVVLQRLARPEHRLTPSLRRASAAVDAAGRSLERWVRRLELEFAGGNHHNSKVPLDSMMCFYSWMPKNQLENDDQLLQQKQVSRLRYTSHVAKGVNVSVFRFFWSSTHLGSQPVYEQMLGMFLWSI